MKKGNLLTKIILRGVLISSVFFITNSTFAGGAGPDAGYKIGGSIKDLEVFKKQKRELIPDVTKLPGYSIVMEQLSQLYSYAPSVAVLLTNSLTSKNWYFAEFPKNDTSIEAERIGRQDENNIYLSYDYKAKPCSSSCSHADENKIRLQGQLIYHEMWVKIARQQWNWNSNNPGHPNQNDVENVVGTLLSQGESYQKSISPQNSLEILLTEFNFRTERTYYGSGRYHAMVGETWPSQFSKIMNFLNSRGIVAKVVYNPRGYIQISFTSDERFKTSTTSTDRRRPGHAPDRLRIRAAGFAGGLRRRMRADRQRPARADRGDAGQSRNGSRRGNRRRGRGSGPTVRNDCTAKPCARCNQERSSLMNTKAERIIALINETRQAAPADKLHELTAAIAGATVQEAAYGLAAYCRGLVIAAQQVTALQRDTLVAQIERKRSIDDV